MNELIVRQNAKKLIWIVIIPTIGLAVMGYNHDEMLSNLKNYPILGLFFILLLSFSTIFLWLKIFDKGVKMIINKDGIWTKKFGLIEWKNIFTYRFEVKRAGYAIQSDLKLDTQNPGRLITIEITYFDKSIDEIKMIIESNLK